VSSGLNVDPVLVIENLKQRVGELASEAAVLAAARTQEKAEYARALQASAQRVRELEEKLGGYETHRMAGEEMLGPVRPKAD
jgi:hypothetical protein